MMSRLFALLALLLLAACSREPSPVAVEGQGAPALWKIETADGKGAGWLFGTVHSLPADVDWHGPVIDGAIRDSDSLVIEVIGLEQEEEVARIFAHMGVAGGLPPLRERVAPENRAQLQSLIDQSSMPSAMLNRMKSWAALLTLSSISTRDWGFDPSEGVERVLRIRFEAQTKPVSGLETLEQQFGMFDGLPEADQRAMLNSMLKGLPSAKADYKEMLANWMAGKSDALLKNADAGLLSSPRVRESLLDGRNRAWADKVDAMLKRGEQPFIAVGAGHMVGGKGLPALLAAKGYKVTRAQ